MTQYANVSTRAGSPPVVLLALRDEFPEIAAGKDVNEVGDLALQCDSQADDGREARHLQTGGLRLGSGLCCSVAGP